MQRRTFLSSIVLTIGLLAGLMSAGGAPASAAIAIQPGARITSGNAACTMNFIYRDVVTQPRSSRSRKPAPKPALYAGTAGHCVAGVGARVSNRDGAFGTVAFRLLDNDDDFAFIRIDREKEHSVNPSMLGFAGPKGVISGRDARPGDFAHVYGQGLVFGETALTRPRTGVLRGSDSRQFRATLPVIFGDSGGPVLHEDGSALGIVAHLVVSVDLTTLDGNTVERALAVAAESGLPMVVVPG